MADSRTSCLQISIKIRRWKRQRNCPLQSNGIAPRSLIDNLNSTMVFQRNCPNSDGPLLIAIVLTYTLAYTSAYALAITSAYTLAIASAYTYQRICYYVRQYIRYYVRQRQPQRERR